MMVPGQRPLAPSAKFSQCQPIETKVDSSSKAPVSSVAIQQLYEDFKPDKIQRFSGNGGTKSLPLQVKIVYFVKQ